jgi:hypothetical protein
LHEYGHGRDRFPRAHCNRSDEEKAREDKASKAELKSQQAFARENGYWEGDEPGKRRAEAQKSLIVRKGSLPPVPGLG